MVSPLTRFRPRLLPQIRWQIRQSLFSSTEPLLDGSEASSTQMSSWLLENWVASECAGKLTSAFELAGFGGSISSKVYRCKGAGPLQVTAGRSDHMTAYITRAEVHDGADRIDADGR